jgi:hypothetical protein
MNHLTASDNQPNADIPATTESNAFQHERLLFPSQRAEERSLFAETPDPKVSIDTIVQ